MHDPLTPEDWAANHILGIYETHLPVRDLDRSLAFYTGQLGLKLAHRLPARNVAFVWAGPKEVGMLGLWGGRQRAAEHDDAFCVSRDKIGRTERLRGIAEPGHHAAWLWWNTSHRAGGVWLDACNVDLFQGPGRPFHRDAAYAGR